MSDPEAERPTGQFGALWGVLGLLLVFGAVGSATFVYGLLGALGGSVVGLAVAAVGLLVALLALLFLVGILYRVDRLRGAVGRRVELFE